MGLLSGGCGTFPSYQRQLSAPNKDSLQFVIYLTARTGTDTYEQIALRELERIQAEARLRHVPLYEVIFDFRLQRREREKLARVVVHLPAGPGSEPETIAGTMNLDLETTLY